MSQLNELYQELIIDHGRNPRHFGAYKDANRIAEGFNPLCGDTLTLYLKVDYDTNKIEVIQFEGAGCAISMASASLMAETLQGKTVVEFDEMLKLFHTQITNSALQDKEITAKLGKLSALAGVNAFPSRVKCATLAWHTLKKALHETRNATASDSIKMS